MTFIHGRDVEGIIAAQKEVSRVWLGPDLMLVQPMKKKEGKIRETVVLQLREDGRRSLSLVLQLWVSDEKGGARRKNGIWLFVTQKYTPH